MYEKIVRTDLTEEQIKYLELSNGIWKYNMALKMGVLCLGKDDYIEFKKEGIIISVKQNCLKKLINKMLEY